MTAAERVLCRTTAHWLAACRRSAGALGLGVAAAAVLTLLAAPTVLVPALAPPAAAGLALVQLLVLLLVLLLVPAERVLALRLAFDAALFDDLAAASAAEPPAAPLVLLDGALQALRLRPAPATPRALAERVLGARALARQHLALVALQALLLAVSLGLLAAGRAP